MKLSKDLEKLLQELCWHIDHAYEALFEACKNTLPLEESCGFLSEGGFTPSGYEECFPIIDYAINRIIDIAELLKKNYLEKKIDKNFLTSTLNNLKNSCIDLGKKYAQKFNLKPVTIDQNDSLTSIKNCLQFLMEIRHNLHKRIFMELGTLAKTSPAPIVISFRDESYGGGAFYDNHTIQRTTDHPTMIAGRTSSILDTYVRTNTHALTYGDRLESASNKKVPSDFTDLWDKDDVGLLVIPGFARDTEKKRPSVYKDRVKTERDLIRQAKLRGQPTIGICGGAWRLWESWGYSNNGQSVGSCKDVADHAYARMPTINVNGSIGNNKLIHRVTPNAQSLLSCAMGIEADKWKAIKNGNTPIDHRPLVNSVHWQAVNTNNTPQGLVVSAMSIEDATIAPKSRTGAKMHPVNCVEAFESDRGAPTLGVQWHPEAFNNTNNDPNAKYHINLIRCLAKCGTTYRSKRHMLQELKSRNTFSELQARIGLFGPKKESPKPVLVKAEPKSQLH